MTNLMEHSTYTLDISSDEEGATRGRHEEGRGKENVPPMEEGEAMEAQRPSQEVGEVMVGKSRRRREEGAIEVDRQVLGEVDVRELYSEGVGEVVIVPGDEAEVGPSPLGKGEFEFGAVAPEFSAAPPMMEEEVVEDTVVVEASVEEIMAEALAPRPAALLEPMEKAEEGWQVWESGSVGGDE